MVKQVKRPTAGKPDKQKKPKKTKVTDNRIPKVSKPTKEKRKHPEFGTSKLEQDFAKNFLDKLGVKYIWQFEAKEIKRFFDFYLPESRVIIEFNGSYFHADPRIYEGKTLTNTQKRSQKVDQYKKAWADLHGIPIIYVWEKDVNENPQGVMQMLKEKLRIRDAEMDMKREKIKRHVNKLNKDLKKE